jgi:hypothetical protein
MALEPSSRQQDLQIHESEKEHKPESPFEEEFVFKGQYQAL